MPFVPTWVVLDGNMLNEVRQTTTIRFQLYVESKKQKQKWTNKLSLQEIEFVRNRLIKKHREQTGGCHGSWLMSQMGKEDREVQTPNCKINKSRDEKYSIVNAVNNTVISLRGDRWKLHRSWWAFHNVRNCQITVLYTWN